MKSFCRLKYHYSWLIGEVDDELGRYYRELISRHNHNCVTLQKPKNGTHITIIAGKYEFAPRRQFWKKYQGDMVPFDYDPDIKDDGIHFWMTVQCKMFETIREELGLAATIKYPWHVSIGNLKY